ncbi:Fascin-like protein [Pandoravirus salinus]|uniref:Fascin-like protein n=1 Tax=Pandoravirus salinus TaxID=1349410 RepID=S4W3T2_9VIRU|nr:Fascin-like protein [Pandoravirus salinus]AGO84955.1 Fascin-like protein [Pandoravirus salinus]
MQQQRPFATKSLFVASALLALLCWAAAPAAADDHHTAFIASSGIWTPPSGAYNFSVTLWGGGGGGMTGSAKCVAGGGSGAAIIDRVLDTSAWPSGAQWQITVGQGGAEGVNGQASTLSIVPSGGGPALYTMTAHAGAAGASNCVGGGGGGADASAWGSTGGAGVPSGANGNPPAEGALIGDVKGGGSGGGTNSIFGAPWGSRLGGIGQDDGTCKSAGGAAGYNGPGPAGYIGGDKRQWTGPDAAPNSGSGGGSGLSCTVYRTDYAGSGGSGGCIVAYWQPPPSPSPSPQPLSQLITLVSPISGKQLTAQDNFNVASLWYGASPKEKWTATRLSNGKYTFQSFTGRYLGAHPGGWVRAEATAVGDWERWDVIINAGNQWTLKSTHGTYMGTTAAGVVYLNDNADLYWTKTTV